MITAPANTPQRFSSPLPAVPFGGLLPTKLHGPRARPDLVPRPELIERIERGLWKKLTLISAAAGSGKSTLVAQWMKTTDIAVAWLSLDEADNETHRFLTYLVAALRTAAAQIGEGIEALLHAPGPIDWRHLLTTVVVIPMARETGQVALVLDDYHVLDNPRIDEIISWLLDHLPPSLHLLILSRQDPNLPLARLRVRGELNELRAEELRFGRGEAAVFYNQIMHLGLAPADIAALGARTEGWAAAIQLSALSLRDQRDKHGFIESLKGDQRPFADYLIQEVLEQQPADVKAFLLASSVLRRMSGPLCSALLNRDDGQAMLERLERANLFVVPLDNRNEWYRYHHLFAELLRQRREQEMPAVAPGLHRRASEWYAEHGLAHEAIYHARRSDDRQWLATLIERWGEVMFMRGEMETLATWLQTLPEPLLEQRPWLAILDAWCALPRAGLEAVEQAISRARRISGSLPDLNDQERTLLQANLLAIDSFIACRRGDPQQGVELAQQALGLLPQDDWLMRSILGVSIGSNLTLIGDYDRALPVLEQAQAIADRCGNFSSALAAMCCEMAIYRLQGRLRDAERIHHEAASVVDREGFCRLTVNGHLQVQMAWVELERYRLEQAAGRLKDCLEQCVVGADRSFTVPAYALLIRIGLAQGDRTVVADAIAAVSSLPPETEWSPEVKAELEAARALVSLREGDLNRCRQLLGDDDLAVLTATATGHALDVVRVRLAMQQGLDTVDVIDRLIGATESAGRFGQSLEWRVLRVVALAQQGRPGEAVVELEHAVILAKPEGALRVFAEHRESLNPLRAKLRSTEARHYLAFLDGIASPAPSGIVTAAAADALVEPLSQRELEVLELAAQGLSNQAIAERLFVSVGTVKTHMHNILSKFDVRNRTEAVHRARTVGLLGKD